VPCTHEPVHWYSQVLGHHVAANSGVVASDSETDDCDGDGVPADFDGDLDWGQRGGAFGHGPWATHCGYHQEVDDTVTVLDHVLGANVRFATGSDGTNSWVPDPVTGENTCLTDGVINPGGGSDCLSAWGTGTQPVVCPGGGDGLLWVILEAPYTTGSVTSP